METARDRLFSGFVRITVSSSCAYHFFCSQRESRLCKQANTVRATETRALLVRSDVMGDNYCACVVLFCQDKLLEYVRIADT
jgi:hypothetical protein